MRTESFYHTIGVDGDFFVTRGQKSLVSKIPISSISKIEKGIKSPGTGVPAV